MRVGTQVLRVGLVAVLGVIYAADGNAHDEVPPDDLYAINMDNKFSLGVAAGFERFDTNFNFTDKSTGRNVFVDAEGTLGLPETQTIPIIYGFYRPSKKHGIGFSFFQIDRNSSVLALDENIGDLNVTGDVTLSDQSAFYYLSYNYTAYEDDRAFIFASFGLYGLDLKYKLTAKGNISFQGVPVTSGEFEREESIFAPLPLLGIDAWFAITPKWAIGAKVALVGGSYNDVSAFVLESKIRTRYVFSKHVATVFGFNYFDADVTIDKDEKDLKTEINYGFDGFSAGLDFRF